MSDELLIFKIDPSNKERPLQCIKVKDELKSLQEIVGGYIELGYHMPNSDIYTKESGVKSFDLYVNEEGLLTKPDYFFQIEHGDRITIPFAGRACIVGTDSEGNNVDVDPNEMMKLKFSFITRDDKVAFNKVAEYYRNNHHIDIS